MVARKTSSLPTRIWSYGARLVQDAENVDRVVDLVTRATRYQNALLAVAANHTQRYRELREEHSPLLCELADVYAARKEQVEALAAELKATPRNERAQRAVLRERITGAKAKAKAASAALAVERKAVEKSLEDARTELARRIADQCGPSDARTAGPVTVARVTHECRIAMWAEEAWPALWCALDQLDAETLARRKVLRAESGLPHGVYALAEQAADAAIRDARPLDPQPSHLGRPKRIGVQLLGTVTWADVISGACPLLRVQSAGVRGRRDGATCRGSARMRLVSIRVGTRPDVYVSATVKLHHEPPPDAIVKWAWLRTKREGGQWRTEVQFTMEHSSWATSPRPAGVGHVEIVPCCVLSTRGIAVATWTGNDGRSGEIVLPREPLGTARATRHSLLARLVYHEAWASALDTAHVTALHLLDPGDNGRKFWQRRALERLLRHWCEERFGHGRLAELWRTWVPERKAAGRHLLERPRPGEPLESWWPRETAGWCAAHDLTDDGDVLAWWAWTWCAQVWHLAQERARIRRRVVDQRDALFRREAIRLSTQYDTCTVAAPRIAAPKRARSQHSPALLEVLALAGVARCAEIVSETFGSRAQKGEACELLADDGCALRDVLTAAAAASGQRRRAQRRRPETERAPTTAGAAE